MVLEPEHEVAELGLLLVGGRDFLDGLRADAGDLLEAARRLFDDVERLLAELRNDAPCELGAEAVDDARAEEALDAVRARRRADLHVRRLELLAEARMRDPAAAELDLLPDKRRRARQRDAHAPALMQRPEPQDGKAAVVRSKDDAVNDAGEVFVDVVKAREGLLVHVGASFRGKDKIREL